MVQAPPYPGVCVCVSDSKSESEPIDTSKRALFYNNDTFANIKNRTHDSQERCLTTGFLNYNTLHAHDVTATGY